jgi:hypothetical protein
MVLLRNIHRRAPIRQSNTWICAGSEERGAAVPVTIERCPEERSAPI